MANIKFNNLTKILNSNNLKQSLNEKAIDQHLYRDLKLDITDINTNGVITNNPIESDISAKDIEISYDEEAVLNSVRNWFQTTKCSRLLNPELALDLRRYLFEGANEYTAYFLGMDIMKILPFYEPRVKVDNCKIGVNEDEGFFIIDLALSIPSLNNKQINLKELLDSSGYTTL